MASKRSMRLPKNMAYIPVQVSQWKKEVQEQAGSLFEKKRGKKKVNEHESPEYLYSEIGRLKAELDWLKKKSEGYL